jgi:hypothetical protein
MNVDAMIKSSLSLISVLPDIFRQVYNRPLDLNRPLDPSGIPCRPPLDPSAGVCFVKRKFESSIPLGSNFSPYLLDGACY